jgi:hypothetical protein
VYTRLGSCTRCIYDQCIEADKIFIATRLMKNDGVMRLYMHNRTNYMHVDHGNVVNARECSIAASADRSTISPELGKVLCRLQGRFVHQYTYAESTHSIDPAIATVDGSLPGEGESIVYFLFCVSIAVLFRSARHWRIPCLAHMTMKPNTSLHPISSLYGTSSSSSSWSATSTLTSPSTPASPSVFSSFTSDCLAFSTLSLSAG